MAGDLIERLRAADPVQRTALDLPSLGELEASWPGPLASDARRRRRGWRSGLISLSLAALVTTGSAAATLAVVTGNSLGRVESTAIAPRESAERIVSVTAVDPDGGPPWTLSLGRADRGLICVTVGQVQARRLGLVGLDGTFRTDAVGDAAECAVRPSGDEIFANARTFVGSTAARNTSVVYGIAGPAIKRVVVRYPDGAKASLPIDRSGAFVIARRGSLTRSAPNLSTSPGPDAKGHVARMVRFGDASRWRAHVAGHSPPEHQLDPTEAVR